MSEPAGARAAPRPLILGGDVGATKTNLGLFRPGPEGPRLLRGGRFASADYPGLAALVAEFLAGGLEGEGAIGAAYFGVPGPVGENFTRTSNLAWEIDGERLAAESGIPRVGLVNDLVATAQAIPLLGPEDFTLLHPGDPGARGNLVLIAAGTGLGMCLMPMAAVPAVPAAPLPGALEEHLTVPSEGGHMDFAARNADEIALLESLIPRFGGHVSVERVVSGQGLRHVYEHLRDTGLAPPSPEVESALAGEGDAARAISEGALGGRCAICERAMEMFVSAYGAAAGNLALVGTATGGVYLGGGIAPKILPRLADGTFVRSFLDKGRFRSFLEAIPVRVILNDRAAMFGAGRLAARLLAASSPEP